MQYTVKKEWGEFKEGDTVSDEQFGAAMIPDQLAALIQDGTLEPIIDEEGFEDVIVDEQFLKDNPDAQENGITIGMTVRVKKNEDGEFEGEVIAPSTNLPVKDEGESEPVMMYNGQVVVSTSIREVNGKDYQHVHLADGASLDITDEEYEAMVKDAK